MKTINLRFGCALCASLLFSWSPAADAGTISTPPGRVMAVDYGRNKTTSDAYDSAGNLLQSSTPSPGLRLGPVVNGQLSIAWPGAPSGFVLESTTAQGPGAVWLPVAAPLNPKDNRLFVKLFVGPTQILSRLHK